jgi:hypothetical protein
MILQKLKYPVNGELQLAEYYFGILSIVNSLELAKREIQLLAFTAVRGNIGSVTSKKEFVEQYDSSLATVGNIVSKLSKEEKGKRPPLLLKENKKVVINKGLALEFEKDLTLEITFGHVSK